MDLKRKLAEKKLDIQDDTKKFDIVRPFLVLKDNTFGRFRQRQEEKTYENYLNKRGLELSILELELSVKLKEAELRELKRAERLEKHLRKNKKGLAS